MKFSSISKLLAATAFLIGNTVGTCEDPDQARPSLLVVMAPGGPVLARLDIRVDRQPYRQWVTQLLTSRLDLDRDGKLDEAELNLIPSRLLNQAKVLNGESPLKTLRRADSRSVDGAIGTVSTAEFASWFETQLQNGFNVVATPVKASDAVRLSALIDSNSDGLVSAREIQEASDVLKFRDLDDDQTFTAAELLPFRDPRNQQAALVPEVANLPMIQITDRTSAERASKQILARFGKEARVSVDRLRLSGDSALSEAKQFDGPALTDWLVERIQPDDAVELHMSLNIQLSDRASASRLSVEIAKHATSFCTVELFRKDSRCHLRIDEMPIEIRSRGGSKDSRGFMINFLLQRMTSYDQDKDQSISEDEFPALQAELSNQLQVTGEFSELDLNSDGMLLRNEVKGFIERDTLATQSRIEVSVRQDGRTLFKLLDQNSDRRLSPRELQTGFLALAEFDFDKDGRVSESELGTSYILTIGLGQAESLRRNPMMMQGGQMASTDAVLPGVDGLAGPEWFRRMDRNQDGDVSWREFLGERSLFDQMDSDSNQLVDAAEAEMFEKNPG